jgi:hypothetical protein
MQAKQKSSRNLIMLPNVVYFSTLKNGARNQHEAGRKQSKAFYLLSAVFFLGLLFNIEEGDNMFLRNFGTLSSQYKALYPRRYNSSLRCCGKSCLIGLLRNERFTYNACCYGRHFSLYDQKGVVWKSRLAHMRS